MLDGFALSYRDLVISDEPREVRLAGVRGTISQWRYTHDVPGHSFRRTVRTLVVFRYQRAHTFQTWATTPSPRPATARCGAASSNPCGTKPERRHGQVGPQRRTRPATEESLSRSRFRFRRSDQPSPSGGWRALEARSPRHRLPGVPPDLPTSHRCAVGLRPADVCRARRGYGRWHPRREGPLWIGW